MPWLGALALLGLGLHVFAPALKKKQFWAWLMVAILLIAGAWAVIIDDSRALIQLVPIMVFLMLAVFFGRTLMGHSVPLVTRIAAAARDISPENILAEMPGDVLRYTRGVTMFWTAMFLFFAAEDLFMLWLALPMPWPLVVNISNFAIMLMLLVGEYLYHSRRYPNPKHHSFLDFAQDVAKFDYHSLLED